MVQWHYVEGGTSKGPVSEATLASMFDRGSLPRSTLVWNPTLPSWVPASSLPAFSPRSAGGPVPPIPTRGGREMVEGLSGKIGELAGTEHVKFEHVGGLFSEVLRRHDEASLEAVFATGLPSTTPRLKDIQASNPTPWVYSRILAFFGIAFLGLWMGWREFQEPNLLPGIMLVGSFAFPLAAAIFFYECNVAKNVPLFVFIKLFVWGGILGLIFALVGFKLTEGIGSMVGPPIAGLIEEPAKLAAVVLLVNAARFRWTLSGMALGAAVGAGFAAFESAGYAFVWLLQSGEDEIMLSVIMQRGLLSPFAHVVWTASAAGALWRVRAGRPFDWSMLGDRRCAAPIIAVMVLHALWNSPLPERLPFFIGHLALGAIGWVIAIGLMLGGLRDIRDAQAATPTA